MDTMRVCLIFNCGGVAAMTAQAANRDDAAWS